MTERNKIERVARTDQDLIQALEDHLGILRDAMQNVKQGNHKYIKTISGTLRVLVHESKTNHPLLVTLSDKFSITPTVTLDKPSGIVEKTLQEYLDGLVFASGTQNIEITNRQLIAKASQQEGGAHEDLDIEKDFAFSKGEGLLLGGVPPLVRMLMAQGGCIASSGERVLAEIKEKLK